MDLAQIPSLDGEGAEGGWGDIKSVSNKSHLWSNFNFDFQLTSNRYDCKITVGLRRKKRLFDKFLFNLQKIFLEVLLLI